MARTSAILKNMAAWIEAMAAALEKGGR